MAIKGPVQRVCCNCGHQWLASPPMKSPSKIGYKADLTYFGKKSIKADRLRSDYASKLNASYASKAAFETCVKCGSTGGIRTDYSPEQIAKQNASQRMTIRLLLFLFTGGISELVRLSFFLYRVIRKSSGKTNN